jgi:hypothetical protein
VLHTPPISSSSTWSFLPFTFWIMHHRKFTGARIVRNLWEIYLVCTTKFSECSPWHSTHVLSNSVISGWTVTQSVILCSRWRRSRVLTAYNCAFRNPHNAESGRLRSGDRDGHFKCLTSISMSWNQWRFPLFIDVLDTVVSAENYISKKELNSWPEFASELYLPSDRRCQRSYCQLLRIEGATWSASRIHTAVLSAL